MNPRFVLTVGACREEFPDIPEFDGMVLWDRQERKAVATFADEYAQLLCLEPRESAPITALAAWCNELSDAALSSEGIPARIHPFN